MEGVDDSAQITHACVGCGVRPEQVDELIATTTVLRRGDEQLQHRLTAARPQVTVKTDSAATDHQRSQQQYGK